MTKRTASELIELALIYAVQDREAMADAWDAGPERADALALAKELRAYHRKRYGKAHLTDRERAMGSAISVSIFDLKEPTTPSTKASA